MDVKFLRSFAVNPPEDDNVFVETYAGVSNIHYTCYFYGVSVG